MADANQPLPSLPPVIPPQFLATQNLEHHLQSNDQETMLLVRHLPEAIPQDTLSRLFSHYGASSVQPSWQNYSAGNRSPALYIKNLAKDVVADDFYFIFGSFFGNIDAAKSSLSVQLMQEGRMNRQAFVTFPSIELAHGALVNLYWEKVFLRGLCCQHLVLVFSPCELI